MSGGHSGNFRNYGHIGEFRLPGVAPPRGEKEIKRVDQLISI